MRTIEAISGLFIGHDNSLLLLQRNARRTYSPNQWDVMGGDMQPGETPEEVLHRDAQGKLNIPQVEIFKATSITYPILSDLIMQRHIFVCSGDYSDIRTNPKSYQSHGWFGVHEIPKMDLTQGAKAVYQSAFSK